MIFQLSDAFLTWGLSLCLTISKQKVATWQLTHGIPTKSARGMNTEQV